MFILISCSHSCGRATAAATMNASGVKGVKQPNKNATKSTEVLPIKSAMTTCRFYRPRMGVRTSVFDRPGSPCLPVLIFIYSSVSHHNVGTSKRYVPVLVGSSVNRRPCHLQFN